MPKKVTIKPSSDISGDKITIDFAELLDVSAYAVRGLLTEMERSISAIQNAGLNHEISTYDYEGKRLAESAAKFAKAAHIYHQLKCTQEGNRETLRFFNLKQEAESVIWDREA